jgi:hypothetical protein
VKEANQIALVHMLFNLTGICIFYPVPWMRLPVRIARVLGSTTATYRWFAVVYLAFMFFIFPTAMFLLSLAGPVPLYCVLGEITLVLDYFHVPDPMLLWTILCEIIRRLSCVPFFTYIFFNRPMLYYCLINVGK